MTDIVAVVGASLELKSAGGGRFKALCPFHREKTPSFTVSTDRQAYHCFGCSKGGDALSFMMEYHGMSFAEALQSLADRSGVKLPEMSAGDHKADFLRNRLREFNAFAARHFQANIKHAEAGKAGRAYLESRKLNPQTVQNFGIGFAQESWSDLLDATQRENFGTDIVNACGMFKQGERNHYDFFRNRLIFPIKDINGHIVAFGGRALGDDPAKYINTPETPIYKKSTVLYGLHEARDAIRKERRAILVEGYFDVLRCFDAGIETAIAPCGTALTPEQAHLIHRYANEVVVLFDGDEAGVRAALKGIRVLTATGLTVRALALPDKQDPDDYILAEGAETFVKLLEHAPDFIAFYASMSEARLQTVEGRNEVLHELFEIVHGMDNAVRADEYLKHMARELNLSEWACRQEFSKFRREPVYTESRQTEKIAPPAFSQDDCDFIAALLNHPELLDTARSRLAEVPIPDAHLSEVLGALFQDVPSATLLHYLENPDARRLYTTAVNSDITKYNEPADLVAKQITRLHKKAKENQAQELMEAIQLAENAHDNIKLADLLRQKVKLQQELERVGQV